jgi:ABC-2 type transport system ATP-binding protein
MMEADELCDRIAIVHKGRILACDTPANLKRRVQQYPVFELALTPGKNGWHALRQLPGVQHCSHAEGPTSVDLKVALKEEGAIGAVVQEITNGGAHILSLKRIEPSLEDAFVELVGHGLSEGSLDR